MKAQKKIAIFLISTSLLTSLLLIWNPDRSISETARANFWTTKTFNPSTYDVVFYGDSRVYRGISPDNIIEGTEFSCYNFGYSSGSLSSQMLDFAASHVDKSDHPTLVIGVTPYSLTQNSIKDKQYLQEVNKSKTEIFLNTYQSGLLTYFDPIKPSDVFGLTGNFDEFNPNGWMSNRGNVIDTLSGLESYEKVLYNNPIHEGTYFRFFDKVREYSASGINVYGFRPPTMMSMEQLENQMTGFDETSFIKMFEEAGGSWIYVDKAAYQTYDGSHLQKEEAVKFSRFLNQQLFP